MTELLIVILIISILAALALSALGGATEMAREQRTRVIIAKIDQLIMERYESYRTRAVPVRTFPPHSSSTKFNAEIRLYALRDLMRMEMPDRRSDVINYTTTPPTIQTPAITQTAGYSGLTLSSLQRQYFRSALRAVGGNAANLTNWTIENQGAECLYLILSTMRDGDKSALDFLTSSEIGDTDETGPDGFKEILDGWGEPIAFLRWAPAFTIENGALTTQTSAFSTDSTGKRVYVAPDPFDPLRADYRWNFGGTALPACYALTPLIISAGRDKKYDIATDADDPAPLLNADDPKREFRYVTTTPVTSNDPYCVNFAPGQRPFGSLFDADGDGYLSYADNITNHYQVTP